MEIEIEMHLLENRKSEKKKKKKKKNSGTSNSSVFNFYSQKLNCICTPAVPLAHRHIMQIKDTVC
ncbi:hypothetical protein TYRP_017354 [Tyrophagus putrescentiae]|nr:hypothetical protein TYRP_017354 [Tyrophagus putrescentiae]